MGVEIEFLAVGDESAGGDATIIRLGPANGPRELQTIIVVDGGYQKNGDEIVDKIIEWYGTDVVDLVVSTHPDQDHISGLRTVIERMTVRELWMHLPWNHSAELATLRHYSFKSSRLSDFAEASLTAASTLEELARARGIPIFEPFTGRSTAGERFTVLGPDEAFYEQQLALMPDAATASAGLSTKLADAARSIVRFAENLFTDNLSDNETTRPRNNTSVISLIRDPESGFSALLTADAGIAALEPVVPLLRSVGINAGDLDLVQVPHHGSRHNVGPTVLNDLLGAAGVDGGRGQAVVSVPAKNPKGHHPSKRVTDAFRRRGYPVTATQGAGLTGAFLSNPKVDRPGYTTATPLQFFHQIEEEE
jgi:beta-lactamase superfamily II metal-dependent hydrolase